MKYFESGRNLQMLLPWEVWPTLDLRITLKDARGGGSTTQAEAGQLPGNPMNDEARWTPELT